MVSPWDSGSLTRQEQLQMVIDTMPEPMLLVDDRLRLVACNTAGIRTTVELFGHVPRAGDSAEGLLPGGLCFAESPSIQSAFAGATTSLACESRTMAGEQRSYRLRLWPAIIEDDTVRVIGVLYHDVSGFAQAEQRLRRAGSTLRQLVDHAPVIILAFTPDGTVHFAEGGALDGLPSGPDVLIGQDLFAGDPPLADVTSNGDGVFRGTLYLDGRQFTLHYAAIPGGDEAIRGYVGVALETTAERQRERAHALERRHESLTRLSHGLSHDLGNILTVLIGNGTMLHDVTGDEDRRRLADEIIDASWRADTIVRQLSNYANGRPGFGSLVPVDLNEVVDETIRLVQGFIAGRASVYRVFQRERAMVLGQSAPLRELLSILLTNAVDAGGEQAVVRISTGSAPVLPDGPGTVQLPAVRPAGPVIALVLEDSGPGMDAEVLESVFDPYYSTRFSGRGLGMANALGIIKTFQGVIHIRSAPSAGTTVTVLLPAAP